ncbi:ABC transporter ATP-binding protein [Draconibacterium sp. IB214405]|uniref:ABC transporter ATP-binding protein n=1 Tax=Draconibacterium sp. IB214405 TaxID=3097352 RepID=UPI002A15F33D|nr:ABC transporter ATP-binding protein [Draconibacterium sp. IB214405]MDX8341083.1 ABC transporter ATP-binding protein [Draconibacterium sp. IB214405]
MEQFFQITNLSCGYPGKFTLEDINFTIAKGDFVGIIGPNGSGKTTLFRGISGELPPLKGKMELNGTDTQKMSLKQRAQNIAIVTQNIEVGSMTVEEYVLMGRIPYHKQFQFFETKEDFAIADKYMKLTGVDKLRGKYMNALSGGEQQLAGIARALTQEPDLLLLDEPTSHLDITHQVQTLNLIRRLSRELGLTVLMIIHDLNLAGEYCDSLIMMQKGSLRKKGLPTEVLNYKDIEAVYETVVVVRTNPISNKPVVFLVSEEVIEKS